MGPVVSGEAMRQSECATATGEIAGTESRAIIGEQTIDADAQGGEVSDSGLQESDGAVAGFIGLHLREGDARIIVDADKQALEYKS